MTLPKFDTGEPFGLPKGTVRGIIALAFAGTLIQQVVSGHLDIVTFIGVAGPYLGFYAATRSNEPDAPPPPPDVEPLAAPVVGASDV